jgi:hypothetical protein
MYPTVVILLVQTQRSMADICESRPLNASVLARRVASDARPATLGHFSVATGPIYRMMDNGAETQRSRALRSQVAGGQEDDSEIILEVEESQVGTK